MLSPPQIVEDLKSLLDQVVEELEEKGELINEYSKTDEFYSELSLSVPQSCKIPQISDLTTLSSETRQLILLVILENHYFLKNYQYELIAAVINSLTRESLPIAIESFIEHYSHSWNQVFPPSGKSKSVWLFHYDCRFWLLLLRIIVKSIENAPLEDSKYLAKIALDKVLKFKMKFKGYGHYPEIAPLLVILVKIGSDDVIEVIKEFCKENLSRVYKQINLLQSFTADPEDLIGLFIRAYNHTPTDRWLKDWKEILGTEDKSKVKKLCNDLWGCYMPTEEECKKLANLSGGTLDMEVILGIQRQLYHDFQDITEYEELGRNITRAAIWSLGLLNTTDALDNLYHFCVKYYQFNDFCIAAIYAIESLDSKEALKILQKVLQLVKNRTVKKIIYSALEKQGTKQGLPIEILKDLITDDCGLDANGLHSWILGRDFLVKLYLINDIIELEYVDRLTEKLYKTAPVKLQEKYKDENHAIQESVKLLKETHTLQAQRLEEAMCQQRSWNTPVWNDIFEVNPINKNFAQRIVWAVYDKSDRFLKHILPVEKGCFIDHNSQESRCLEDSMLKIAHPILLEPSELSAWKKIFHDRKIIQPFEQLNRKIFYLLEDETDNLVVSKRFSNTKVFFNEFQTQMNEHFWTGFTTTDFDESNDKYKDFSNLLWRAYINVDMAGINIWDTSSPVVLGDVFFCRLKKRGKQYKLKSHEERALLKDVNPIIYSETVLDIILSINENSL